METLRFEGRVIAVTGAAQGMGREHALLLARRGAKLVVNDIKGAAESVVAIREAGGEAMENCSDITDPAATDRLVQDALDAWGRLDGVINNAAVYGPTLPDPATTEAILGVHLFGTINLTRSALPVFREQGFGRIVNVGSGSMFGLPGVGIYATGKGGVFSFTRSLARDLEQEAHDIKANVILPAAFKPGVLRVTDPEVQQAIDHAFTPANTSPLVAVLMHEACPVNGEVIQVGGGRQARIVLASSEGWQAPDDAPTPEGILDHWSEVMSSRDLREPTGSMSDLLVRRGLPDYSVMELVEWTRTGKRPVQRPTRR